MEYMIYGLAVMLAILSGIFLMAFMKSNDFRITRSIKINVSPEPLFPYINNIKKFQEWNPFRDKDPNARNEFSGPDAGPGAVFYWKGNSNAGEGYMRIQDIDMNRSVHVDLEFIKPFPGHNQVEFRLEPQPGGTVVSWNMQCKFAFIPKLFSLFINMEKMIGADFEKGLQRLKGIVESGIP